MRPWYSGGGWLAVKECDLDALMESLSLAGREEMAWADFIPARKAIRDRLGKVDRGEAAAEMRRLVFVSPCIDGWRLLAGYRFCAGSLEDAEESTTVSAYVDVAEWCRRLSARFGEAHSFTADWDNGVYSWILARDGVVYRQFVDASGEVEIDEGEPTAAEERLRAAFRPEHEEEPVWSCYEHPEQVASIAAECSIHPARLPECPEKGYLTRWQIPS